LFISLDAPSEEVGGGEEGCFNWEIFDLGFVLGTGCRGVCGLTWEDIENEEDFQSVSDPGSLLSTVCIVWLQLLSV